MNTLPALLRTVACFAVLAIGSYTSMAARASVDGIPPPRGTGTDPTPATGSSPVIELSPFIVDTSRDVGFVASDSLAGGRLSSDLRDTAAAYSVLTREFIDALQLTDLKDATKWTVNASSNQDDSSNDLIGGLPGVASVYTTRGTNSNGQFRNFFPTTFNPDSYNIDRFDYSRGPNAVLFGPGGISGTANIVTKRALLQKRFTELRLQFGAWDKRRASLDTNIPVAKNFAMRVNALLHEAGDWRENTFDHRQALHVAGTWQANRKLRITAEAEWGRSERAVAIVTLLDQVSGWDGTTVFNGPTETIPAAMANASSAARYPAPHFLFASPLAGQDVLDFGNNVRTRGGNTSTAIPVGGVIVNGSSASVANFNMLNSINLPSWEARMRNIYNSPLVPQATKDFFTRINSSGSDFSQTLDAPNWYLRYRTLTLSADQKLSDRWFLQLSGNYLRHWYLTELVARSSMNAILLDLTRTLPSGQPNSGFLHPFSEFFRQQAPYEVENKNLRASLAYVAKDTRWGGITLNLSGGIDRSSAKLTRSIYAVTRLTSNPRTWGAVSTINGVSVDPRIFYRYYWTQNTPGNRPLPLNPTPVPLTLSGQNFTGYPDWVLDTNSLTSNSLTSADNTFAQASAQWSFWKKKINLFGSTRYDAYHARVLTPPPLVSAPEYAEGWDGSSVPWRSTVPNATYFSLPAAQRSLYSSPDVNAYQPTYAVGSVVHLKPWLAVFGDYGTSFNANGVGRDIYGSIFAPRVSKGWDAGFRFSFLQGKVVASVNRYGGNEENQQIATGGVPNLTFSLEPQITNIINARPIGAGTPGNARGLANVPTGYSDRRDLKADGYEFELTANPTKSVRLMANFAVPKAYQTNAYSGTRDYLAGNDGVLRQILNDAGVNIDANNNASVGPDFSPDAAAAAQAWNNLAQFRTAVVAGAQKIPRLPGYTANLYVDYRIDWTVLRGLRTGAGINYRGREIIGNHGGNQIPNPANRVQSIADPKASPYSYVHGESFYTVSLTVSYPFRLKEERTLSVAVRVDNVLDDRDVQYFNTAPRPPDGNLTSAARVASPNSFYYKTPRNLTLTTTLRF